ncbi:hypothetical protein [Victivallis vadensis]|uniref:hypothetical protein n=1 Tax=Victivallis vadensis TaxID=172901 RepID=UPI00266B8A85|nr:hypothetical protein [Victivallis vadensis]
MRTPQHSPVSGKLAMVGKFLFAAAAVAALLNVYIYLNQKIAETQRQIRKTERVLHETAQLRIQREQLMAWPHIKNMIARFDLKLHGPNPGQVATMSILTPDQAARIPLESVAAVRTPGSGVIRN